MAELSFEEKMKQLESLISRLESGNTPLQETVQLYEQGLALYNDCDKELKAFEERFKKPEQEA